MTDSAFIEKWTPKDAGGYPDVGLTADLAAVLAEAVQVEREACAKFLIDEGYDHADLLAAAIRRRGA